MDIGLAKTYLAVAECGSFIEAAERLHVTQSTVSARIKSLEEQLGQILFERSKAGATLTPAGDQFHKHAMALVRVWEHAKLEVGFTEEHRDHLAIGGQVSLWDGFLLSWIARLRKQLSDVAVTATIGIPSELMEQISEGTMDIAIMYRPAQKPGTVVEHLFDEELVMVTSRREDDKPIGKDYVFVNWGPEFQADHAMAFPDLSYPGLNFGLGSLGVNYLLENNATGYFPMRVARPHIARGELRMVKRTPRFVYPAYAVYPEQRDDEAFEPILEGLREIAGEV